MKRFSLAIALFLCSTSYGEAASSVAAHKKPISSTRSKPKINVLQVTESSFVSLTFDVSGGYAGTHSQLVLDSKHITLSDPRRNATTTATWIRKERAPLFKTLNDAKFPTLAGNYQQKNLADGFNETVTLKLRQGKSVCSFVVQNYGDRAPKAYYKVTMWLRNFQTKKFPVNGSATFHTE